MLDNIVIGELVDGLTHEDIGILPSEHTLTISLDCAAVMDNFLPKILVYAKLFKTTSEIKRIARVRLQSTKIVDIQSRTLWRTISTPELTHFKIGKRSFWLVVGDLDK